MTQDMQWALTLKAVVPSLDLNGRILEAFPPVSSRQAGIQAV